MSLGSCKFAARARTACGCLLLLLTLCFAVALYSQTFQPIYTFTCGSDGASPRGGLIADSSGNLYGTTQAGGNSNNEECATYGCGTVFRLSPTEGGWKFKTLYSFQGGEDGVQPADRLTIGPDGALYGTTWYGGAPGWGGGGIVFKLTPDSGDEWHETVIHRFQFYGQRQPNGALIFDKQGDIIGVTHYGGWKGNIYKLVPLGDGVWQPTGIGDDGSDDSGVVFGTTEEELYGTDSYGSVYELSHSAPDHWQKTILYDPGDSYIVGPVLVDKNNNLYGTTAEVPADGSVFRLGPPDTDGHRAYTLLWTFHTGAWWGGDGPMDSLVMDAQGNLYGTTLSDGFLGLGSAFKLERDGDSYNFYELHDFTGQADGGRPFAGLTFGAGGKLYGVTVGGGQLGKNAESACGVVFEITP